MRKPPWIRFEPDGLRSVLTDQASALYESAERLTYATAKVGALAQLCRREAQPLPDRSSLLPWLLTKGG